MNWKKTFLELLDLIRRRRPIISRRRPSLVADISFFSSEHELHGGHSLSGPPRSPPRCPKSLRVRRGRDFAANPNCVDIVCVRIAKNE
ncbi:unnamed protein product [Microthlaspi erraticum]|uniref:Uncharacterized protein n=1 Tax=Microthlaspi erraticum TaxID=1685480 RepID=A0A6D2LH30_9BRAS|nr:unnamed protein product [Microthlaspi erraticum]